MLEFIKCASTVWNLRLLERSIITPPLTNSLWPFQPECFYVPGTRLSFFFLSFPLILVEFLSLRTVIDDSACVKVCGWVTVLRAHACGIFCLFLCRMREAKEIIRQPTGIQESKKSCRIKDFFGEGEGYHGNSENPKTFSVEVTFSQCWGFTLDFSESLFKREFQP